MEELILEALNANTFSQIAAEIETTYNNIDKALGRIHSRVGIMTGVHTVELMHEYGRRHPKSEFQYSKK